MASLVAYGSSDESGNDEDDITPTNNESPTLKKSPVNDIEIVNEDKNDKSSLFSSLPVPKTNAPRFSLFTESNLSEIRNTIEKKKQPVKITIPSLSEVSVLRLWN